MSEGSCELQRLAIRGRLDGTGLLSYVSRPFYAGPHFYGVSMLGVGGFLMASLLGVGWAVAVLRSGRRQGCRQHER